MFPHCLDKPGASRVSRQSGGTLNSSNISQFKQSTWKLANNTLCVKRFNGDINDKVIENVTIKKLSLLWQRLNSEVTTESAM